MSILPFFQNKRKSSLVLKPEGFCCFRGVMHPEKDPAVEHTAGPEECGLFVAGEVGDAVKALLQVGIGGDVVGHLAVVELLVGHHVEVAGAGEAEDDSFRLARLLALESFVDGDADGVAALRGGQDELSATAPAEPAAAEPGTASLLHLPGGHGRKDTAKRRRITLYDLPVSAGIGEFLSDAHATEISIPDVAQTVDADFALRIAGDSMEPNYHDGDILLVRRTESVTPGELGIFVLDGCGYFKKFDGDRLLSLNPAYPPILLKNFTQTACCGQVIGRMRKR